MVRIMAKAILVSGCPRSGTSLTMLLLATALGEDRIIGQRWPKDMEPPKTFRTVASKIAWERGEPERRKAREKAKEMNPLGFWECGFTVEGLRYELGLAEKLKEIDQMAAPPIVKVVSQGLRCSDPVRIEHVIYLTRSPREVATSQENLVHANLPFDEAELETLGKIHSPKMYNNVTMTAGVFFYNNPDIPVTVIDYSEDMIRNPDVAIATLRGVVGEGNWDEARKLVNPKYYRSRPRDLQGHDWDLAERLYKHSREANWSAIVEEADKPRPPSQFFCVRYGVPTCQARCEVCLSDEETRRNLQKGAEKREIDWREEPCLYELGFSKESFEAQDYVHGINF